MFSLVFLAIALVVVVLAMARRSSSPGQPAGEPKARREGSLLRRAVEAGIVTEEQAAAVLALDRPPEAAPARPERVPPVLEVLGYLGAVLVMVGAASLVARFWDDLATWSRITIVAVAAVALTATGLAIRDEAEPVLWRLRSVVLFVGSAAVAGAAGLIVLDALDIKDEPAVVLVGGAAALHAGLLWWRRDRPAQQLACGLGLVAVVAASVAWAGGEQGLIGLALWVFGAAALVAAQAGLLPPAVVGTMGGAGLTLIAAGVFSGQWQHAGVAFGLLTAAALVAAGVRREEFLLTGIGVMGSFVYLPATVNVYFGGTMGVPAVMLVSGAALLGFTAWLVQHRAPPPAHHV